MIKFLINNRTVNFNVIYTILQAGVNSGVTIPKFCYHPKLSIAGNCRMCLVQLDHAVKLVASCSMAIANGIKVSTKVNVVRKAREAVLEFLLINHPLDCPICDQGGECDLQDQTMIYGGDRGRFYEKKRAVTDINLGSTVKTFMSRCIHCTRCIRFLQEISGSNELGLIGRGNNMRVSTFLNKSLKTYLSGNIADICPVGALTSKPYAFSARPWEILNKDTLDPYEIFGESLRVDFKGAEIIRILPIEKYTLLSEWLTDRSRLFFDGLTKQRFTNPLIINNNSNIFLSWSQMFFILERLLKLTSIRLNVEAALNSNSFSAKIILKFGILTDVEALSFFKHLSSIYSFFTENGKNSQNINFYKPFFKSNYLFASTGLSEVNTNLLFINFNPAMEAATLNLHLKKIAKKKTNIFFSIGCQSHSDSDTLFTRQLGLTTQTTSAFLKGRHGVCRLAAKKSNKGQKFGVLIGTGLTVRADAGSCFSNFLSNNLEQFLVIKLVSSNYSQLNRFELSI